MTVKHPIPRGNAKRVAVIVTEYRYNSHADVILGRLLGDFDYRPRVEVASIYTDQVPANDMSRSEAARCGIPIYATIAEAIKAPYAAGGLDGVIIIEVFAGETPLSDWDIIMQKWQEIGGSQMIEDKNAQFKAAKK